MIFKWEYRTVMIPNTMPSLVNDMVRQGWAVVVMGPVQSAHTIKVIFKRRKWFWQK